jgi:hypothetical protein
MEFGKPSHTIAQAIYRDLLTGKNCFKLVGHGRTWRVEENSGGSDKVDVRSTDDKRSLGNSVVWEKLGKVTRHCLELFSHEP